MVREKTKEEPIQLVENSKDTLEEEPIQPVNHLVEKNAPRTLDYQGKSYDMRRMALMVSQFNYDAFLKARKQGDSPEATKKALNLFTPLFTRKNQIKKLEECAKNLYYLYSMNVTGNNLEKAETALLDLVFKTKQSLWRSRYRQKSNLETNLEQVLSLSDTSNQLDQLATFTTEGNDNKKIGDQLMFKDKLSELEQVDNQDYFTSHQLFDFNPKF